MAYQKDISAILGLSISTVSKALKGYPDVSEETRRKVLKTAEVIDYRCRGSGAPGASDTLSKKCGVIGILAPGIGKELRTSKFKKEVVLGIVEEAAENNADVVIMDCEEESGNMSCMGKIAARNPDGICLLADRRDIYNGRFAELFESCIPLVSVGEKVTGHISVCCDRRENIRILLRHIRDSGHLKTAYLGDLSLDSRRTAAILEEEAEKLKMSFREGMGICMREESEKDARTTRPASLEAAQSAPSSGTCEKNEAYSRDRFMSGVPEGVTCIIVNSDRDAEILTDQWRKIGIRVPQDISVAALETEPDREEGGAGKGHGCTGIDKRLSMIGKEAARILINIVDHPEADTGEERTVSGVLADRGTVRRLSGINTRNY